MEYLIQQGSDVDTEGDNTGWTPFNAAVQYGNPEVVQYLMTEGSEAKEICWHDSHSMPHHNYGHLGIVKFFVSKGANVNEERWQRDDLLSMEQPARGHMKVMEYLIQQGSDVNKKDNTGWTPFNAAVQYGHHRSCQISHD